MARAYASIILKAPVETVWSLVRDFNGLPKWAPNIAKSGIENGLESDVVVARAVAHLDANIRLVTRNAYRRHGEHPAPNRVKPRSCETSS